jgi:hypothetical protein
MPILDTTQWGVEATTDAPALNKPAPKTGFVDGVKATWQQESIWVPSKVRSVTEYPNDSSFDFKSYDKKYWPLVAEARNKEHAEDMVAQFEKEQENKNIMENQSFALGLTTNIAVGLTNPLNYIGVGKAATIAAAAAKGAVGAVAGTAATEVVLQGRQVDRSTSDSLYNIAGAAVLGAPLGAGSKLISNKLARGSFLSNEAPDAELAPIARELAFGGRDSIGAARATERTMTDSKLVSIPFLPKSWTEPVARMALPFARSANQRLQTSTLSSVRNAQNILLRTSLATEGNALGVANQVPIEVAVGQRSGTMLTALKETDFNLREAWWKKVEGGTYDKQEILDALRAQDPTLGDNYQLNRTSFDKVLKIYMADDASVGSRMHEVVERVKRAAEQRAALDADKIDFGLARKEDLIDIATGERLGNPDDSIHVVLLRELREQRAALVAERETLKATRTRKGPLTPDEKAARKTLDDKIAGHDEAVRAKSAEVDKLRAEFDSIIPSSKTHKFAYEDGAHYLHRVFDKGRIMGNRKGFIDALIQGWAARNPELNMSDMDVIYDLRHAAETATNKLMNEEDLVSLGDLVKNLDLPGKYTKGRTLNVDDRYLTNWTHDDVTATEAFHITQATVDVELARQGVKFNELLNDIKREKSARVEAINEEHGVGTKKAANLIAKVNSEAEKDIAELEYAMRRLKRQSPLGQTATMKSANSWLDRANRLAGMAQLGSSALPNSLGDVASVARTMGSGSTYKLIGKMFTSEARADMKANAKQLGVLSSLVDKTVREAHLGDQLAESMNPNKGFKSTSLQTLDRGLDHVGNAYAKYSLIDGWSRVGRTVASTASVQHILEAGEKGWGKLSGTTRTDLAKFYIDEDMLNRITVQAKKHGDDKSGVKFAGVEKWDDVEAARVFQASVYAHTEHALNIPSIGTGSQFMTETFFGRMLTRFKTFNNASHESSLLSSMQNREYSRIITGTLNYAFWGFAGTYAYDVVSGRPHDFDTYFGSKDAMIMTAWKTLAKGGYVAAASDAFVTVSKLAGHKSLGPISEVWRAVIPEAIEEEIFPKFDRLSAPEKALGPTYGYASQAFKTITGFMDGDISEKDIHGVRTMLPGQNIGWLRRGIDYVEEYLGGYAADRKLVDK